MKHSKGIIIRESPYSVKETTNRLEAFFNARGITIYARINQQAELQKAGLSILPLEFILFGNPKAGGPVMMENPVAALDLPLKIIAWEDDQNKVFIAFNDAAYIEERHSLKHNENSPLNLDPLISMALK